MRDDTILSGVQDNAPILAKLVKNTQGGFLPPSFV